MARRYVPRRGDVVWINLDPVRGHEQAGVRPVLVVSAERFNRTTGLAYIIPITSRSKGYAIEVAIESKQIQGVALTSNLRAVDWRARKMSFADTCPESTLRAVQGMLVAFIVSE